MTTPTPLRRRIRHARRLLGYGALMLLILLALLVGIANQLLPMVERHPERIAAWLGERVGEPVSLSSAHAEWTRRGPRLILDGLQVGAGADRLVIGRAQLQVAMYSGLLPGQPLTELKVRELSLTLVQEDDGRWRVLGLPGQGGTGDPLERLEGFGELQIEKARLRIRSTALKVDMLVPRVDARIRVDGARLRAGVSAWVDPGDPPVSAVLEFHRQRRDGLLWVGGEKLVLAHWAPLMAVADLVPERGSAKLSLWARVDDRRVTEVTVRTDVTDVRLRSLAALRGADGGRQWARAGFEQLQASARWRATANGWRVDAPRLNITRAGKLVRLDGLTVDVGDQFRLLGKELDLSPLASMLALSDRLPDRLRVLLLQANPQAVLREVVVQGRRGGELRGSMAVSGLGWQAQGKHPGLSGVAGQVLFDESGGVLRLGPAPVRLSWPTGLRQPMDGSLQGTLALWRNDGSWSLATHGLRLQGTGFGADLRARLDFQGDGSAPVLALAADLDPASFATAKTFWILHRMPPATIRWLDTALVEGMVSDGRIALAGDLDDWPFGNGTGSFDARAHIGAATLKFNESWPAGEQLELDVAFDGPGFSVTGAGQLLGNPVEIGAGGIASFHEPWLDLDISSKTGGASLRQLMLASPLEKSHGEHLRAVTVAGPATVATRLRLPLREGLGTRSITGSLDLDRARLQDPRWDLAFTQVSGRTRFTAAGFATEDLAVAWGGQPAIFNLRVGEATGDRNMAAVATLDGRFTAASLIARYPVLSWLKSRLDGTSRWNLAVRVPAAAGKSTPPASQLSLSSDLVGTTIKLPAPLAKPATVPLRLELQAPLPIERGELNLRLGNLMRLRGQLRKAQPMAGLIQFGPGPMAGALPATGLSIRGNVDLLDTMGWVAFAGSGTGSGAGSADGGAASVRDVDVRASRLVFIERAFADSRVRLTRGAALTEVRIEGQGIDGTVGIPSEMARGVQGRFSKLHLPADGDGAQQGASDGVGSEPTTAAAAAAPLPATPEVKDPGQLPPLRFTIDDLRFGLARLGSAELVTTPIVGGMRVDRFRTRTRNLQLSAAGEWARAGSGTESNFSLRFNAGSLGQMLDALGFKDIVEDGPTKATLAGRWPGSPGAFSLATLRGTLQAEVGAGRILDVEPGGSGRILGLISLAEIPRRLSLDFSDFFQKGFAFNTAAGDFIFVDGKARTENLVIDGPAAEIRVTGDTGLRNRVYDQRVEVLPKAGGLLPAIGLLAAGPAGAAVGAVAQAVLQRPLKQTTRVVYRVTGPWSEPEVVVVEKGPARGPAAAASGRRAPAPP